MTAVGDGLVLGVDVATSDVRVRAVDGAGATAAEGRAPLPAPDRPQPGHAEQDARAWWPAVRDAIRQVTSALGTRAEDVRALAICATSGTVVPVAADGEPTGPALMYDDRRGAAEAERAQAADAERWGRLGLTISPAFALAKVGWLAAHGGLDGVARICHTPDLLAHWLVGSFVAADSSHALKTGWDALEGSWPHAALAALGIDEALLGAVRRPTESVGTLSSAAAEATGLPRSCEVRLGMTDGCAGQVACGAVEVGQHVSVLGTTLVLKGVSADIVRDPSGAVYCHRHPDGSWLPGGASSTGGEALRDFPRERLAELDRAAAERGPACGVIAYPLKRSGERFPFVSAGAEGFVDGVPVDEVEAYRAALEGVAYLERVGYDHLAALGAPAEGPVATAGGGSRSEAWLAIRATVLDRPLIVVPDADTATGAARLAAAGTLHPDLATATANMARAGRQVDPVAEESSALAEGYGRFRSALEDRGWL